MRGWKCIIAAGVACLLLSSSTCYAGTIYACRKKIGGTIRIVGASATCLATETKMSWPNTAEVTALKKRLAALESLLQHFSRDGNDLSITGANLQITSGSGTTDGAINGLGNLIVGYNELRLAGNDRTGSHNIIVGARNNYSNFGGLVAGYQNTVSGAYSSVSGGFNTASGSYSSVSGGEGSTASGPVSSVSGGLFNTASGSYSSVSGGEGNTASGSYSSVSGGRTRSVFGDYDWRAGDSFQEQ